MYYKSFVLLIRNCGYLSVSVHAQCYCSNNTPWREEGIVVLVVTSFASVMAHTVISAKYPPLIDATRTPLAYGDRALPRLVSIVCQSFCELMQSVNNISLIQSVNNLSQSLSLSLSLFFSILQLGD